MVWISVVISLCHCYAVSKNTKPGGFLRLTLILPVVILFLLLPLNLTSVHFIGTASFFVSWLANFKLLLLSFGTGPLSSSDSLPNFIAFACLPIKLRPQKNPNPNPLLNYLIKGSLLAVIIKVYDYGDKLHPNLLWIIYFFHIYFMLELILASLAAIAKLLLGIELEPQFNEPLLSSSLQDFWGKRWNLMASSILRPTVYHPVLDLFKGLLGKEPATLLAVMSTFVVSTTMHELIFYYIGRTRPTFEVTGFFLLHGASVCLEMVAKRELGSTWKLHRVVSGAATAAFVITTGFWLFLPPMLRFNSDQRALQEYTAVGAFFRRLI